MYRRLLCFCVRRNYWQCRDISAMHKPLMHFHGSVLKHNRSYCQSSIPKGVVYESISTDIFTNLAFEDWVYNNLDLSRTNLLLFWRNKPCVVIGRHQNPWAECQLRQLWGSKVELARRRSGGGTVYHDLGNLNCSFFTSRSRYNRKENLELITNSLRSQWPGLDISVSCRDDILLDNFFKVSGSSAKLGSKIAYHHCTLLHNVNATELKTLLHCDKDGLTNRATESVRSAVKNLTDVEPSIVHKDLVDVIANNFYKLYPALYTDEVYSMDPSSEVEWPGVKENREELQSWEWIYGKTPQFSVQRSHSDVTVLVHVNHACIMGVVIQATNGWIDVGLVQQLTERLTGKRFWPADVADATSKFLSFLSVDPETRNKMEVICSLVQESIA